MPTVVNLIKNGENKPSTLEDIDNTLCAHLGVKPNPDWCYLSWWDHIGFPLACGRTLDQLVERFTNGDEYNQPYPEMAKITRWIKDNYTVESYHQKKGW